MDFEALGTAIAILSKADPIAALATGVLSGIFGKALFDKRKTKKQKAAEAKANKKTLEQAIILKGEKDAKTTEQDS